MNGPREVRNYLNDPSSYFGSSARQSLKLESSLERIKKLLGITTQDLIDRILAIAKLRVHSAKATVYVHNIGSSGSHWLSSMMSDALGILTGGELVGSEIYIGAKFRNEILPNLAHDEAKLAIHAIMLAHFYREELEMDNVSMSNSSHMANINTIAKYDSGCYKILLTRDPIDIVISRTFRKNEYREFLGHKDTSDLDYARINIERVEKFFQVALKCEHDLVCRFEDLSIQAVDILEEIARSIKIPYSKEKIEQSVKLINSGEDKELNLKTKLNKNEREYIEPEVYSQIKKSIMPLREQMGYV